MLNQLRACFSSKLPGLEAQLIMAPAHRQEELQFFPTRTNVKKSSVLIIFFQESNTYKIVFIKRARYNGAHSGQISFPGGKWEKNDKSLYHTALRESYEEIGVDLQALEFCGKLTDLYIPPSNFIVSPYVVVYHKNQPFSPDQKEVDSLLEIPFSFFLSPDTISEASIILSTGVSLTTPCYNYKGNIIWGATAMIMCELVTLWKTTV